MTETSRKFPLSTVFFSLALLFLVIASLVFASRQLIPVAVAFVLAFGSLLIVVLIVLKRVRNVRARGLTSIPVPMAIIILLALGDALVNSFLYFPAILIAGALAAMPVSANTSY